MAGKPGRSGGHNRRSIAEHIAAGTYRKDRHGPKPARVAAFPATAAPEVPGVALEGLREPGHAFVTRCWAEYRDWSAPQLLLLQRAGQLVDLETSARDAGDVKQWQSVHRLLLLTLAGLGLRET